MLIGFADGLGMRDTRWIGHVCYVIVMDWERVKINTGFVIRPPSHDNDMNRSIPSVACILQGHLDNKKTRGCTENGLF